MSTWEKLSERLKKILDRARQRGAKAFASGDYQRAAKLAEMADRLSKVVDELQELQRLAADLDGLASRPKGKVLPKGVLTPLSSYYLPVLKALVEAGGAAEPEKVVERVGQLMKFNEYDLEPGSTGQPRWRQRVHVVRRRLVRKGLLRSDSPKGLWEISAKGRQYYEKHKDRQQES